MCEYCCKLLAIWSLLPISLVISFVKEPAKNKFNENKNILNRVEVNGNSKNRPITEIKNSIGTIIKRYCMALCGFSIGDSVHFFIAKSF